MGFLYFFSEKDRRNNVATNATAANEDVAEAGNVNVRNARRETFGNGTETVIVVVADLEATIVVTTEIERNVN